MAGQKKPLKIDWNPNLEDFESFIFYYVHKKYTDAILFWPVTAIRIDMNPGHGSTRRVSSPGPGFIPGQGRRRGASD